MRRTVVIVSFDGGKPAVMQAARMPRTHWLAHKGAHTWAARTVVPSVTLPSHTSMLTGVGPETHKITWNDYQKDKGVVEVPTVFTLAKKQDLKTALIAGKEKFKHLNIPGSLDYYFAEASDAKTVAQEAVKQLTMLQPDILFLHFPDPDGTGHDKGWGSPEQFDAFARCDDALGTVLDTLKQTGLARSTALILSADHGGHDKTHGTNRPDDVLIPWIAFGSGIRHRRIIEPVYTCDTAATALHLLGISVPADWEGRPVQSALRGKI
jgi:predicted AlkP superfamily pyrophosphatase or phosphodiesterase